MGKREFEEMVERLRVFGLKPNVLPTNNRGGSGIGGTTEFLATVEIPCALAKMSGTLTVNIVENPVPLLFPVNLCKALGLVLDLVKLTASWSHSQTVSDISELPSGHLAIDILEFGPDGWENPLNPVKFKRTMTTVHTKPLRVVPDEAFRCAPACLLYTSPSPRDRG